MEKNNFLEGPSTLADSSKRVQNIVLMLHGYGSNGSDLIQIAKNWEKDFPNIYFSAPNAPFTFDALPYGFKWFEVYPDGIPVDKASDQVKNMVKDQLQLSIKAVKEHINYLLKKNSLTFNKLFILGFSQGSMMSLEIGTQLQKSIAGILSLSGRIYSEDFAKVERKKTPILVVHGEEDEIIPTHRFYETCDILKKSNFNIETHLIKTMGHSIDEKVMEISKNFIKYYR